MAPQEDESTEAESAEGWEPRVQTCRIVLWRGYVTSAFYARATDGSSGKPIVEPSASFRSRRAAAPGAQEARSAHADVVSRLESEGWIQTGRGAEWYATEFARSVLVPVSAPDTESAQPAAEPPPEPAREPAPVSSPPPEPAQPPPVPAAAPRPSRVARAPQPRRPRSGWRVAAATGLLTAIGLLGWAATHPSVLHGAAPRLPARAATAR